MMQQDHVGWEVERQGARSKWPQLAIRIQNADRLLLVGGLLLPWLVSEYQTTLLTKFLIFGILAISLDFMWGYAGILNFGHAAFFGLGAYTMGLLLKSWTAPGSFYVALIAAIAVPGLLAAFLAWFLFYGRVGGVYFSLATLVVSLILQQTAVSAISLTGGDNGLYPIPPLQLALPGITSIPIQGTHMVYYIVLGTLVLTYLGTRRLIGSNFGRLMAALRDNEVRAESFGYDVAGAKLLVFAIGCALAGFSGAVYAPVVGFVSPDLLGLGLTTQVLVWVTVGGRGTLIGPAFGAILVNLVSILLSGALVNLWFLIMGLLLIAVVIFRPEGLFGYLKRSASP